MSSPAVTVIVPGFDVAAYADEALASLRAQTRDDWRAVLVDDGSSDATGAIYAAAAASDHRFEVITHHRQRGLAAARNTGLDAVTTPYVAFLDSDDRYTPAALETMLGTLEESGSDLAIGAYVRLRPQPGGGYASGPVQPWVSAATAPARRGVTLAEHPEASGNIVAWSKVSRADFWQRTGLRFPEGRLYEDQQVAQRMYTLARAFDTVPDVIVEWRERADGTSITQHESALGVLRDCLDAMAAGLAVLDDAGQHAAADARVRLMLTMDVPRLARIAETHPDAAYRRALGEFTRALTARSSEREDGREASIAATW